MQAVKTSLTQLLGIRVPIVCAAMAFGTNAQTAVEVTRGGGFGFVGAAFSTPESLKQDFAFIRDSFPELGPDEPLPVGYGFIGWLLDKDEEAGKQLIDIVLENGVRAIWLAFGDDIHHWVEYVRTSPANARRAHHKSKPLIFLQATSVDEALVAANEWKVDVIVAQGAPSSSSPRSAGVPTRTTRASSPRRHRGWRPRRRRGAQHVPVRVLGPRHAPAGRHGAPVLAAGGMATGAHVAAHLALGAAGAVLGTRFLLTPESPYKPAQKAALLAARSHGATVRTLALDYAGGTACWPAHVDGRGLRNGIVDDVEAGVDHAAVRARCEAATEAGDAGYMVVWAGQGVGLMNEIKPIKDVMAELHTDLVKQLQKSRLLLQES